MTLNDAAPIIEALANGLDPDSGAPLPAESIVNRTTVVRALMAVAAEIRTLGKREAAKLARALGSENSGMKWSEDDDRKMLASFDAGRAIDEIAASMKRTKTAVRYRLVKYGRLAT